MYTKVLWATTSGQNFSNLISSFTLYLIHIEVQWIPGQASASGRGRVSHFQPCLSLWWEGTYHLPAPQSLKTKGTIKLYLKPFPSLWSRASNLIQQVHLEDTPGGYTRRIYLENTPGGYTWKIYQEDTLEGYPQRIHPEDTPGKYTWRLHPEDRPRGYTRKIHLEDVCERYTGKMCQEDTLRGYTQRI